MNRDVVRLNVTSVTCSVEVVGVSTVRSELVLPCSCRVLPACRDMLTIQCERVGPAASISIDAEGLVCGIGKDFNLDTRINGGDAELADIRRVHFVLLIITPFCEREVSRRLTDLIL